MEWAPSLTMPSSTLQLSRRACWKYRSPKSIPGPSSWPKAACRRSRSRPAGTNRRSCARQSMLSVISLSCCFMGRRSVRRRDRAEHTARGMSFDQLHLRLFPRSGDMVGTGADLAQGLGQYRIGGRTDGGTDRATGNRTDHGQQVARMRVDLHGLVEGLCGQVGLAMDADLCGGRINFNPLAAGQALAELHIGGELVEGQALGEQVAEIEQHPAWQLPQAQQPEHPPGTGFDFQQLAVAGLQLQAPLQAGQSKILRATGPLRLQPDAALAAAQLTLLPGQGAKVLAAYLCLQRGARLRADATPAALHIDGMAWAAHLQHIHLHAIGQLPAAQQGRTQRAPTDAQIAH